MNNVVDGKILRVMDANFNRLRDGLRVIEDTIRFVYENNLYVEIRNLRRNLYKIIDLGYISQIRSRSVETDKGKNSKQSKHKNLRSLLMSNFSRCSESLRVLEEYSRLTSPKVTAKIKSVRFKLYKIEKKIVYELFQRKISKKNCR